MPSQRPYTRTHADTSIIAATGNCVRVDDPRAALAHIADKDRRVVQIVIDAERPIVPGGIEMAKRPAQLEIHRLGTPERLRFPLARRLRPLVP